MSMSLVALLSGVLALAGTVDGLEVQQHLSELGYEVGQVDGKVGPKTKEALRKFQRDEGLKVTGHPDRKTLAKLEQSTRPIHDSRQMERGAEQQPEKNSKSVSP